MAPPTILSVAEKPSVAKELAGIISRLNPDSIKRHGFSPYNHVYDIQQCNFKNSPAKMKMTSVTGHLMELEFDPAYKGWSSCQPVELFGAPVSKSVKKEGLNIEKTLKQEARQCDTLLLWLDCDLEGENIAYEVINVCLSANPRLDVYRARFSALVDRDIMRAMKFPDRPNPNMNDAVEARQEIDLRIGAAFTRFQTLRLQKKYENVSNSVISFGPCQFPTLGFVVDRSVRIKVFCPEDFWYITCDIEFDDPDKQDLKQIGSGNADDGNGELSNPQSNTHRSNDRRKLSCSFNWERSRLYDQFSTLVLYELCVNSSMAIVTQCNQRPTSKTKPVPLNTIDFQVRASRFLHMGSERAMNIAESLYQRGILSYPRTETNFFQDGINLQGIVAEHRTHPDWGAFASSLIDQGEFQWPRRGGKDDQAHPPIHPTKCVNLADLANEDERKVYNLVARHFLACCSTDARGSQTKISLSIPPDPQGGEIFHATGLMVTHRNWLDVYVPYERWSGSKVPVLKVGDLIAPSRMMLQQGRTTPPEPLSEAELISVMDKNGIGTDATIATHISTIQAREYATKNDRGQFEPTRLGLALVEGYNSMGYKLNKPQLRAVIEMDCNKIAKGEAQRAEVVARCLNSMRDCFVTCNRDAVKLDEAMQKYFASRGAGGTNRYRTLQQEFSMCGACRTTAMELRRELTAEEAALEEEDGDEEGGGGGGGGGGQPARAGRQGRGGGRGGRGGRGRGRGGERTAAMATTAAADLAGSNGVARFVYCPTCAKAHPVPSRGMLIPAAGKNCAICSFQALIVRNTETNKDHTICPHCFSNPPAPPVGIDGLAEFRCFSCAHSECSLALRTPGGDVSICSCPGHAHSHNAHRCTGKMYFKKTSKSMLIGCDVPTCKSLWWVPKFVRTAQPMEGQICTRCQQRTGGKAITKLLFRFNLSSAPPGTPPEAVLCPSCDPLWRNAGEAALYVPTAAPAGPQQQQQQQQQQAPLLASNPTGRRIPSSHTNMRGAPAVGTINAPQSSSSAAAAAAGGRAMMPPPTMAPRAATTTTNTASRAAGVGGVVGMVPGLQRRAPAAASPGKQQTPITAFLQPSTSTSASAGGINTNHTNNPILTTSAVVPQPLPLPSNAYQSALAGKKPIRATTTTTTSSSVSAPNNNYNNYNHSNRVSNAAVAVAGGGVAAAMAPPMCSCGKESVQRTVVKQGENTGRLFFTCSLPRDNSSSCGFFQWADAPVAPPPPPFTGTFTGAAAAGTTIAGTTGSSSSIERGPGGGGRGGGGAGASTSSFQPQPPRHPVVQPPLPPPPPPPQQQQQHPYMHHSQQYQHQLNGQFPPPYPPQNPFPPPPPSSSSTAASTGTILCNCGFAAVELTVRKEGENKGKRFLVCSKQKDDVSRCNFFQWAHEL